MSGGNGKHDGASLLDDVRSWLRRFVGYPSTHAAVAHTLWIAHTHLMDEWDSTPRIAFLSPEPGSGKTRGLEVTEPLVPNPVEAVNVTPAYLFRKIGEASPTVLYDEIDTVFGPKAKDNEEIRGLLYAGHRRAAVAGRCVVHGKVVTTEEIPAYCAVAFAGIGELPDTILSRCVVLRMRRRAPHEQVEAWRRREHAGQGHLLRAQLQAWSSKIRKQLKGAWPSMPVGVAHRDADVWEALLAVADAAGAHWSVTAREAAVALLAQSKQSSPSVGILLLQHLHDLFLPPAAPAPDWLHTETILERLRARPESPWADLRGKPLDARGLASRLGKYDVRSVDIRTGEVVRKGYRREHLGRMAALPVGPP